MNCCLHEVSSTVSFFIYTPATAVIVGYLLIHMFLVLCCCCPCGVSLPLLLLPNVFFVKWPVMNCSIRTDYLHLFIFLSILLFAPAVGSVMDELLNKNRVSTLVHPAVYVNFPLLLLPLWHIYSCCCCFMSITFYLYPCCYCFLNLHD
jgi:hypothetical protein